MKMNNVLLTPANAGLSTARPILRWVLAAFVCCLAGISSAQIITQDLVPTPTSTPNKDSYTGAVGAYFETGSSNVLVSHLGYYSTNTIAQGGLKNNHYVGLFPFVNTTNCGTPLAQVNVPAGTTADYYTNQFYWMPLDPPVMLQANTTYYLLAQQTANDGDWTRDQYNVGTSSPNVWNYYFVGSQGTATRSSVYCAGSSTWPPASNGAHASNKNDIYGGPCLSFMQLPNWDSARVGVPTTQVIATSLGQNITVVGFASGGTPITYQWWQNGVALSGQTGSTLTLTSVNAASTGIYYLTASNTVNSVVVGEQSANITIAVSPVILATSPQTSGQTMTLFAGANATFAVTSVIGITPFSYQWYTNDVADANGTSANYALANLQASSPTTIACVVTNVAGAATNTWTISVITPPTASYPATVLADNPIGYWRLNESDNGLGNNGAVANDYWGGNSGVYSNTILGLTGYAQALATQYGYTPATDPESSAQFGYYFGSSQSYPSVSNYVANIPNINFATNANGAFSIEAWAKGDAAQTKSAAGIVAKGAWGAEQFTLDMGGTAYSYRFTMRGAGTTPFYVGSNTNFPDGNWHHLVGVLNEPYSNALFYVDGVLVASTACPYTNGVLNTAVPVSIGARQTSGLTTYGQQFFGDINDVAIYNYALSAAQVLNHYDAAGIAAHFNASLPTNAIVSQGANLAITASVIGTPPLTNQWYDITSGSPGTLLTGQTNATLVISNIQAAAYNGHTLALTTSNFYGGAASNVVLTVNSAPVFTQQPSGNYDVFAGSTASWTFTVAVSGEAPIVFNWLSNGVPIAGATSTSFTVVNPTASALYSCWATNTLGWTTSSVASVTVLPSPSAPYPAAVLADNPIGYWRLNETNNGTGNNGVIANDYWGGNDGIYSNTILGQIGYSQGLANKLGYSSPSDPTETSAEFGFYPAYGAQTNYVANIPNINFATPTNTTRNFTVEAWVNGAAQTYDAGIVTEGYGGSEQFNLDTGSDTGVSHYFRFFIRDAGGNTHGVSLTTLGPDSYWHHLVGVVNEQYSNVTLYADGALAGTASCSPSNGVLASSGPLGFGCRPSSSSSGYNFQFFGNINDVAIYNYALSSTQVLNHYLAAGVPPSITQQPVSYTNVDEGTTLTVPAQAYGSPALSYQWYDLTASSSLPNQTNATLVISNIQAAAYDGHVLELIVTNLYGQATSSTLDLSVVAGPPNTVTVSPPALTLFVGQQAVFTVTAQGTVPFSYQWSVDGTAVAGATNSSYTATAELGGHTIGCTMTNTAGIGSPAPATAGLTGVTAPTDSYGLRILADQPLAFWRLDEPANSSVANDYVGGHDGNYNNAVNGLAGFSPSDPNETATGFGMNDVTAGSVALEYDQSPSGIPNIDFSQQGANPEFSVEAWVNAPAGQKSGAGIVTKGYGSGGEQFDLDVYGGAFRFFMRDASTNVHGPTSSFAADGGWHLLVGVCDAAHTNVYLYIDGALKGTSAMAAGLGVLSPLPATGPILTSIGSRMASSTDTAYSYNLSNSVVAQVALYDYALSSNQVVAHYSAAAEPATISVQPSPASLELYQGDTVSYTATAEGSPPLAYQWYMNGAPIAGETITALTLANLVPTNSGSYDLVVTNAGGAVTSSVVTLTVLTPVTAYDSLIVADSPLHYWRLNETSGAIAYDCISGLNGTYGADTTNGVPGVEDPPFFGFPSNNTAVAIDTAATTVGAGYVTAPALNLNTNTVTITAWVYPFANITAYDGVVFMRQTGDAVGITYVGVNVNEVGYCWNSNSINCYGWQGGLFTPPGQWSFVALTIAPARAVMYVGANGVLLSATNVLAHIVEPWNAPIAIGADTQTVPGRVFNGAIDAVGVFDYTMSPAQIAQLYSVATVSPVLPPVYITNQWSSGNLILSWPIGTLLQAPTVTGPWTTNNAASPYTVTPSGSGMFYRVRVQ